MLRFAFRGRRFLKRLFCSTLGFVSSSSRAGLVSGVSPDASSANGVVVAWAGTASSALTSDTSSSTLAIGFPSGPNRIPFHFSRFSPFSSFSRAARSSSCRFVSCLNLAFFNNSSGSNPSSSYTSRFRRLDEGPASAGVLKAKFRTSSSSPSSTPVVAWAISGSSSTGGS